MSATPPPTASAVSPPADGAETEPGADGDDFGTKPVSRFGADVEYRGRSGQHDYVVRVRHRFLETTFTLAIDGVEHDPKAEEKARVQRERREKKGGEAEKSAEAADDAESEKGAEADDAEGGVGADDAEDADGAESEEGSGTADDGTSDDDLRFGVQEGFSSITCTVRRSRPEGPHKDAEVITIRTAGLGAAGEVEVRHGFATIPLVPAEGSPSAVRDAKRTAHPTRYALVAAVTQASKFLLPLLGLGALFSGLLDPVEEWVAARLRPLVEAVRSVIEPVGQWIAETTRPVREFLDELLRPVREVLGAIRDRIGEAWSWLMDLLFGWLPDFSLGIDIPDWVFDVAVPVLVVVLVFLATLKGLRRRGEKLEESRAAARASAPRRRRPARSG